MISVYDTASSSSVDYNSPRTRTGSPLKITSSDLTLLAQIIPPFMAALKKKRRITMCLESDLMTVVQNILRDRPGARVTLVSPATGRVLANPYGTEHLSEIFSKHVNLKLTSSSAVAWWKSFVRDNSDVFEPIFNHVRTVRTAVAQQVRVTKRKTTAESGGDGAGGTTSVGDPGFAVDPCANARTPPPPPPPPPSPGRPSARDAGGVLSLRHDDSSWITVQQQMHDQVVKKQLEPVTPPASPRLESRRFTGSEQLQTKTYASTAPHVTTATLFDYFYDELESVPETYAPLFDRNDLYLTNVAEARRLFQLEAAVSQSARDRVARGLRAVDPATFPFLAVVCVRFHGTADEPACSYVTWCLKSACPAFLDGVLHHVDEIQCNHAMTELVERCSRRLGVTANQLRLFFSLEIIDDSIGTLTEKSLPVFLATLTGYVDQYANPSAGVGVVCLNVLYPVPHVRHRLIFESGSLNAYRFNWLYAKSRRGFVDKITAVLDAVRGCVDIIATFASRYFVHLSAVRAFSSSYPRAAHEINGLWDLFQQQFDHGVIDKVAELNVHFLMLKQIARDRKSNLERAHAAALVFQFRDGVKIPETLSALYEDSIEDREFRATHELFATARRMIKQLTEVKQGMIDVWAAVRDTVHDPGEMFSLLSALVLLRVWVPTAITCPASPPSSPPGATNAALLARCQTLADGFAAMPKPPRQLTAAEIRAAYLKCHLEDHPDKCTSDADKHAATVRSQVINEANERLLRFYTPAPRPT
jgi:hypothetical protein